MLVVDDEPHIRAVLRGYLEADGFAVAEAADGEEAVRQVRQDAPDLVLLDVMLPGIDGLEALRQVRTFSDVYVIVVTARAEEVDKLVGLGVGADDYVTKPFSPRQVAARVKAVLRRGRGVRDTGPAVLSFEGLTVDPVPVRSRQAAPRSLFPRWNSMSWPRWPARPGGCFRAASCWSGCGAMTSSVMSGWWTCTSAVCAPGWAMMRRTRG